MRTQISKLAVAATFGLALAFIFSCSSGGGGGDDGGGSSRKCNGKEYTEYQFCADGQIYDSQIPMGLDMGKKVGRRKMVL